MKYTNSELHVLSTKVLSSTCDGSPNFRATFLVDAPSSFRTTSVSFPTTMLGIQRACRRHVFPLLSRGNATLQTSAEGSSQIPPSLLSTTSSETTSSSPVTTESAPPFTDAPTNAEQPSESPSTPKYRSRAIGPRRRPNISLENPRKWNPPVKKGLLPAYDEAMKVIEHDSKTLKKEAAELTKRLEALSGGAAGENTPEREAEVESIRKKLSILDIQAYINLPSVRWKAANGMGGS